MDVFRQRITCKYKGAIVGYFLKEIYAQSDIVDRIILDFGEIIIDSVDEIEQVWMLRYAVAKCNCNVFMFILDNKRLIADMIDYDQMLINRAAMFVIQHKEIPPEYITKFFTLFERYSLFKLNKLAYANGLPNNINCQRLIVGFNTLNDYDLMCAIRTRQRFRTTELGYIIYLGSLLILALQRNIDVSDEIINDIVKYMIAVPPPSQKRVFYDILIIIAKYEPDLMYAQCYNIQIMEVLKYLIPRCNIETINRFVPYKILCYEHYKILVDANIFIPKLLESIANTTCTLSNMEFLKIIAYDVYIKGYTLFTTDLMFSYNNMVMLAVDAESYDDNAVKILSCKHYHKMLRCSFPSYQHSYIEVVRHVLETYG